MRGETLQPASHRDDGGGTTTTTLMRLRPSIGRGGDLRGGGSVRRGHELRSPLLTDLLVCQLAGDDSRRTVARWPARVPER